MTRELRRHQPEVIDRKNDALLLRDKASEYGLSRTDLVSLHRDRDGFITFYYNFNNGYEARVILDSSAAQRQSKPMFELAFTIRGQVHYSSEVEQEEDIHRNARSQKVNHLLNKVRRLKRAPFDAFELFTGGRGVLMSEIMGDKDGPGMPF